MAKVKAKYGVAAELCIDSLCVGSISLTAQSPVSGRERSHRSSDAYHARW